MQGEEVEGARGRCGGDPRYLSRAEPAAQHVVMTENREAWGELKVMPNRFSLIFGAVGSGVLLLAFPAQAVSRWVDAFLAIVFVSCVFHILWPSPLILATQEGLYLGISRFGRSFFVPWNQVEGVVLTSVRSVEQGLPRDALGFVIIQDDAFKLPVLRWNSAGRDAGPPYSEVIFQTGIIDGDAQTWVEKLEKFRRDVRHISA